MEMSILDNINFNNFIGHKTIIYGEINTGKTEYTAKFVQFLLEDKQVNPKATTILDFGPNLKRIKGKKIGGKIEDFYKKCKICNYLTFQGEIIPPRLNAKSRDEIFENANHNYLLTSKVLKKFIKKPTNILIINDISIYLHVGDKQRLLEAIRKSKTFFGNTYYGNSIKSNFEVDFSLKERLAIENLLKKVENSYKTI